MIFCHNQRGASFRRDSLYDFIAFFRIRSSALLYIHFDGFCRTFSNFCSAIIDTTHPGGCRKWYKLHILIRQFSFANAEFFFCQNNNAPAFRCLICKRRQLCGIRQIPLIRAANRKKRIGTAVS